MVRLRRATLVAIGIAVSIAAPAYAGTNLITNGSFEYSSGTTQQTPCQVGYNCSGAGSSIAGWTMDTSSTYPQPGTPPQPDTNSWYPGYTFVMDSTTAVNGNAGALTLYTAPISPEDGVNFLAQDSVYHPDAIQQSVNLVNGQEYDLNFYWATGQQTTFSGDTYDEWQVSLGGSVLTTTNQTYNPNHGSTGWVDYDYKFTWTGPTESVVISFLDICPAASAPSACGLGADTSNGPPFSLLDNVSLTAVPEPSTWAMLLLGFAGLAYAGYRGRARAPVSIV
jgi:PEP-CTERM motif